MNWWTHGERTHAAAVAAVCGSACGARRCAAEECGQRYRLMERLIAYIDCLLTTMTPHWQAGIGRLMIVDESTDRTPTFYWDTSCLQADSCLSHHYGVTAGKGRKSARRGGNLIARNDNDDSSDEHIMTLLIYIGLQFPIIIGKGRKEYIGVAGVEYRSMNRTMTYIGTYIEWTIEIEDIDTYIHIYMKIYI